MKILKLKKLAIGTANFQCKYGVSNKKLNNNDLIKIIKVCKKKNILMIDTALSYQNKKFPVICKSLDFTTKINPNKKYLSLNFCKNVINKEKKKLNDAKIYAVFFHRTKFLKTKTGLNIVKNFKILQQNGFFKKLGISIYDFDEMKYLVKKYSFDIIQCPYNLIDQRLLKKKNINFLKKNKIEVHGRSIFLQGLLTNKKFWKKKPFMRWEKKIKPWFDEIKKRKLSPIDICLSDAISKKIDKIIIGVENYDQFNQIINFKKIKINSDNENLFNLNFFNKRIIDPRSWKINN